MLGACWRCTALVALVTLTPTISSVPVHASTCEASASHGPAGATKGRCSLQHHRSSNVRARPSVQPHSAGSLSTAGQVSGGDVIVEEEDEAEKSHVTLAVQRPPLVGETPDVHVIITEEHEKTPIASVAAAKIPVSAATISNSGDGGGSSSNQHSSIPVHIAQQELIATEVGSGVAWHEGRGHKTASLPAADEAVSTEEPDRTKGVISMVSADLHEAGEDLAHFFSGVVMNMSSLCQQVPSLASRTWASVHAKERMRTTDTAIGLVFVTVILVLVCRVLTAWCGLTRPPGP